MYLMYVDESGDPGITNSPTSEFILSGLVFHELRWHDLLADLLSFRSSLRTHFGLKVRDEIHAAEFMNGSSTQFRGIPRNSRLVILRLCLDWLDRRQETRLINVKVDKRGKASAQEVYETGWRALIQRFENTLQFHNFAEPKNPDDRGVLFTDNTDGEMLRKLVLRMRKYNPIPNAGSGGGYRDRPLKNVIEDPVMRDSGHSYFVQMVDVIAYFVRQYYRPSRFVRQSGAAQYIARLSHVLLKQAAPAHLFGIVEV